MIFFYTLNRCLISWLDELSVLDNWFAIVFSFYTLYTCFLCTLWLSVVAKVGGINWNAVFQSGRKLFKRSLKEYKLRGRFRIYLWKKAILKRECFDILFLRLPFAHSLTSRKLLVEKWFFHSGYVSQVILKILFKHFFFCKDMLVNVAGSEIFSIGKVSNFLITQYCATLRSYIIF